MIIDLLREQIEKGSAAELRDTLVGLIRLVADTGKLSPDQTIKRLRSCPIYKLLLDAAASRIAEAK